jgi:VWFA-related protein
MRRFLIAVAALAAIILATDTRAVLVAQQRPTFSAAARLVLVSVTVRDDRGRPVTGLTQDDFEVWSDDTRPAITEFSAEASPVTTALLVDQSGSMQVSSNITAAREAARHLVSWMTPATDRLGLFTFDSILTSIGTPGSGPFSAVSSNSLARLSQVMPFGQTSLYDAVDATSKALMTDAAPRRAVVAFTDGIDTASVLTAAEVAARAAAIDVPVYIVAVVPPVDNPSSGVESGLPETALAQLANWTGGQLFVSSAPSHASQAARTIITDLRQQYLLAFTADTRPGWHRLTVRTRQHQNTVRTRAGYVTR